MKTKMNIRFNHDRLREVREHRGFKTTYALAKKMGIAPHQVDRAGREGKITLTTFLNLCNALQAEPAQFFKVAYIENN